MSGILVRRAGVGEGGGVGGVAVRPYWMGLWGLSLVWSPSSAFVSETECGISGTLEALFLLALFFLGRGARVLALGCRAGVLSRSCWAGAGAVARGGRTGCEAGLWAPARAVLAGLELCWSATDLCAFSLHAFEESMSRWALHPL